MNDQRSHPSHQAPASARRIHPQAMAEWALGGSPHQRRDPCVLHPHQRSPAHAEPDAAQRPGHHPQTVRSLELPLAPNGRYSIITPMRNEMRTIEKTIQAVLSQTVLPTTWIILDDGSTDGCESVVAQLAATHAWVSHVKVRDRGHDFVGQGVAELLNHGLQLMSPQEPVEFISKLDADLDFAPNYFEGLLARMQQQPRLGIISGHPFVVDGERQTFERHSSFFPSGTARLYRGAALNEIGRFAESVGWDTIDILRMRMRGWLTRVDASLPVHHMRRMGTRQGYINGMVRDGHNNYLTGYTPAFLVLRALFNARYYPYVLRTGCMLYGYFRTYLKRLPRAVSDSEYAFHAKLQRQRLLLRNIDDL